MKITKELLERHSKGLCTEEEKKAVEQWFEELEGPVMSTRSFTEIEENKKATWGKLSNLVPELEGNFGTDTRTIPLYHSIVRYAAVACIIFVSFFGGRFFASTANASEMIDKSPKDMLYIYGGNGAEAYVPGQEYKIRFEGLVKLFNGSMVEKKINVGEKAFTLKPFGIYYLAGSLANPVLLNDKILANRALENDLEGDFSILCIDQ